ncbi:conserved hypothetical protein [Gammaproteobacteria bacterium]
MSENNTPVQSHISRWKQTPWISGIIAVGIGSMGLAMAKMMIDMGYYMGQMTAYIGSMSNNVDHMSKDMAIMRDQFLGMNRHVGSMEFTLKELNSHMIDMSATVMEMDSHMILMQNNIKEIQAGMARDMSTMRTNFVELTGHVRLISENVNGMNFQMNQMVRDINRGSSSFTSPMNYMQNMMYPR